MKACEEIAAEAGSTIHPICADHSTEAGREKILAACPEPEPDFDAAADVEALRDRFHLPGMKILQFAFDGGPENPYLPVNHTQTAVVHTGTHDNDTVAGWWESEPEETHERVREYLRVEGDDISWDFLRVAWASRARLAVAPLQDFLELGTEARMNTPSTRTGNWAWRFPAGAPTAAYARFRNTPATPAVTRVAPATVHAAVRPQPAWTTRPPTSSISPASASP